MKFGKILRFSIKAIFYLIILAVNLVVIWRICFSGDPSEMKTLMVNENTAIAYENSGDTFVMFTQEQRSLSSNGYFAVTNFTFIPEARQLQVTVRYNNSTLRHIEDDYGLDSSLDRKNEIFEFSVVKTTDLTPNDSDDNLNKENLNSERYYPSKTISAYKTLYSYRKMIFDNIDYEDAVGFFVDMYYIDDIDYETTPSAVVCIYDSSMENIPVELTKSDKKALEAYKNK